MGSRRHPCPGRGAPRRCVRRPGRAPNRHRTCIAHLFAWRRARQ
ncbi:insulinase family protein, partial [Xanthomonas oryzae pv. oryzae]